MKQKHDNNYDFSGWATKANILCSDGRTIMPEAFIDCDGVTVPLVWNHQHDSVENVLGHALLKNVPNEGVRVYGYFNDDEMGRAAKERVNHKDITNLSIYANKLKQNNGKVTHGVIREVSLVLAGANPGAVIDSVLAHSDDAEGEAIIYTDEEIIVHAEEDKGETMDNEKKEEVKEEKAPEKAPEKKEKTGNEVFETLNDEQKTLVYALVGAALEEGGKNKNSEKEDEGEEKEMKHNVFENDNTGINAKALKEARKEFEAAVIKDAKAFGSMKESFLAHSEAFEDYLAHSIPTEGMTEGTINRADPGDPAVPYGIGGIDLLFPEAKSVTNEPEFIRRKDDWVTKVMNGVHHTPFSRIKSVFADITEDEARAKGYITGNMKKNEVFTLLKRATDPQTVYKKQKLDRDDILDITDFDVVRYLKREMRWMLDEELAAAFLVGDGRDPSAEDKIQDIHIRPIAFEAPLFNVKVDTDIDVSQLGIDDVASETAAKLFVRNVIRSRKNYRGSGNPTLYMGEDLLTEILLLEDGFGHLKYDSVSSLATTLRVKEIVTVPIMDERAASLVDSDGRHVLGIIVNLDDYRVGTDKGGEVNMFDDFDIDYNQQKYLIETRLSGALVKPFSAITIFGAAE